MTFLKSDKNAPQSWSGNLPVTSRYTFGIAGEKFFSAIKDGQLLGTRCPKCEHTYVPGVLFCERCLAELDDWVDLGTTGKVHTFTLLYANYDGSTRENPEVIALISFGDGGIIHRLGEITPEEVKIGMEVQAVFKPTDQRQGSITDIEYFMPVP